MRLLLIGNPWARAGRAGRLLPAVRAAFTARGAESVFLETAGPGQATGLVAGVDLDAFDGVVAVGGDGTLHEVLNGLFQHEPASRKPLGVVPAGTGNALAREFGLGPRNWEEAVTRIARGETRRCDVGRVEAAGERFHFLNIIGIGLPSDAVLAARRLKFAGNAAYTLAVLWQALKLRSYPLVIELDGLRLERENLFAEVSNSRYTGSKFLIAPGARMDDGLLDVTLLGRLGRVRLLRLFPTVYHGGHVAYPEIETFRACRVRIASPPGALLTVDGEVRGRTPVEIECLPGAVDLLA